MASPQKENGYTPIANEIMEALIKYPLPGSQMQCLLLILRKLYGYNKKHDAISYSQFEKYTNMKRRHVDRAIKELICKNVISVKKGITKLGNRTTTTYCFNKDYDTWGVLPKKVRGITKKCKKVLPKKVTTKDNIQKKYTANLKKFTADFISYVKKTHPTKAPTGKKVYESSLEELEKLIRLNKFEEDYIFNAIRWAVKDDFWKGQVFSLAGLRKKQKNGLLKFQNLSNAYDRDKPEESKPKISVFKVDENDRSTENAI